MSKVSLVITNFEAEAILRRCVPGVLRYAQTSELVDEIVLVDDGSKDGSCEFVRRECPTVKLIALPDNRGFSRTANAGFRAARNPHVLLLSNDMVPVDGCVEQMLPHLADETVFAVTPRQLNADGSTLLAAHGAVVTWGEPKWRPNVYPKAGHDAAEAVTHFGGAVALYNRRHFLDLAGFDEDLFLPFCVEDTDLYYRAWKRGFTVVYEPRARVFHYHDNPTTIVRRCSKPDLERIVRKNRFLYVWKNVHARWMIGLHTAQTVVRLMFSWLIADFGYYRAFADALKYRRLAFRKRHEERLASRRSDAEAIKAINALRVCHAARPGAKDVVGK